MEMSQGQGSQPSTKEEGPKLDKDLEDCVKNVISCHIDSILMSIISSPLLTVGSSSSSQLAGESQFKPQSGPEIIGSIDKIKCKVESFYLELKQHHPLKNDHNFGKISSQFIGKHLSQVITNQNQPEQIVLAAFELLQLAFEYFYFILDEIDENISDQLEQSDLPGEKCLIEDDDEILTGDDGPGGPCPGVTTKKEVSDKDQFLLKYILLTYINELAGEVGRYRFLNDLIRLTSPKYLGQRTSTLVKQRAVQSIHFCIHIFDQSQKIISIPSKLKNLKSLLVHFNQDHENEIREILSTFKKNLDISKLKAVLNSIDQLGLPYRLSNSLRLLPNQSGDCGDEIFTQFYAKKYFMIILPNRNGQNPHFSTTTLATKKNSIFDTPQNSERLKRLLSSTDPGDISEANHFIQELIEHDTKLNELKLSVKTLIKNVEENCQLLWEVLYHHHQQQEHDPSTDVASLLAKLSIKYPSNQEQDQDQEQQQPNEGAKSTGKLIDFDSVESEDGDVKSPVKRNDKTSASCARASNVPLNENEILLTDEIVKNIGETRNKLAHTFFELIDIDDKGHRSFNKSEPVLMNQLQGEIIDINELIDHLVQFKKALLDTIVDNSAGSNETSKSNPSPSTSNLPTTTTTITTTSSTTNKVTPEKENEPVEVSKPKIEPKIEVINEYMKDLISIEEGNIKDQVDHSLLDFLN